MKKENENKEIAKKFLDIISKIDKEKPSEQNLRDIKENLSETQKTALSLPSISRNQIYHFIHNTPWLSGVKSEPVLKGIEEMREDLGYSGSSTIEQLLIDEIIQEFLRTNQMQTAMTALLTNKEAAFKTLRQCDLLLKSAQTRFHKSIQTLTNLRKSKINLQINIAKEGGQQINRQK